MSTEMERPAATIGAEVTLCEEVPMVRREALEARALDSRFRRAEVWNYLPPTWASWICSGACSAPATSPLRPWRSWQGGKQVETSRPVSPHRSALI